MVRHPAGSDETLLFGQRQRQAGLLRAASSRLLPLLGTGPVRPLHPPLLPNDTQQQQQRQAEQRQQARQRRQRGRRQHQHSHGHEGGTDGRTGGITQLDGRGRAGTGHISTSIAEEAANGR